MAERMEEFSHNSLTEAGFVDAEVIMGADPVVLTSDEWLRMERQEALDIMVSETNRNAGRRPNSRGGVSRTGSKGLIKASRKPINRRLP